ncbi:UNVERIFIED_CONTAM: hypothetical protein RMT77_000132 [Armadillidium vulgare]
METIKLLLVFCALAHVAVSENKVVCYFTNWAWYRPDIGKYMPEDIDPDLCTHINYGFATLSYDELIMKPYDSWADIDNEFYAKVTAYSSYGIKVLISLGGWNDSAGDKYHRLATDPAARANFITNALAFVNQYGFGGIDLDWEYPVCPQNYCNDAYSGDKDGFSAWVQELAEAFHPEGLLVTAAVSAGWERVETSYDVPSISTYLDHINVMTYDYHGSWDGQTGHVSPLYAHPDDVDPKFNTDYSIHDWIDRGADSQKVILGIPFYGQSFTLADASNNGLNAQTYGGGEAGTYTRQMGFLAYYEICYDVEQGWTVVQDPLETMGPYAYSGTQWVSYDDIAMVQTKSEYIVSNSLGGAMIWALDLDDFTNRCGGSETYPLLKTVNRVLRGYAK